MLVLGPLRKIYLWLVPNFVYVHLFNNRTIVKVWPTIYSCSLGRFDAFWKGGQSE